MRTLLLCLLLCLPASAAPLDLLLRTPPWELREGDAAEALADVLEAIRNADEKAINRWIESPAGENPLGGQLLDDAAEALKLTRFTHPDDPLADLPDPDLGRLRTLGRLLAAEGIRRGEEGGWDAAAPPLRAAVRLGHHLGDAPGLTRALVGIAVHQRVVQALEALAGEPGIPNLHATLANLANQRIDPLPAAWTQLARPALNDPLVQAARDAADHPDELTDADWDELLHRLVLGLGVGIEPEPGEPLPPLPPAAEAAVAALTPLFEPLAPAGTEPASRRLIEGVLAEWDRLRGEAWADTLVPYHALRGRKHMTALSSDLPTAPEQILRPFISTPLPALAAVADLQRRLRALQGAEALRLHASASHDPSLPGFAGFRFVPSFPRGIASLHPPVPVDPFTGELPVYEVSEDGQTAVLRQVDLPGDAPGRAFTHLLTLPER